MSFKTKARDCFYFLYFWMALRLSKYFGTSPQLWLNLQNQYDLHKIALKKQELFSQVKPCEQIVA